MLLFSTLVIFKDFKTRFKHLYLSDGNHLCTFNTYDHGKIDNLKDMISSIMVFDRVFLEFNAQI